MDTLSTKPDWNHGYDGRWQAAVEMARLAGQLTLGYFQSDTFDVIRKGDDSPVTIADRQAEQLIRREVQSRFPQDGFLGEEFEETIGTNDYKWIVDPIDGTKSFISGVPLYSTLVGLLKGNQPVVGVIVIPALDEVIHASAGQGAWHQVGRGPLRRARVSNKSTLGEGLLVTSQVNNFHARGGGDFYHSLESQAYITRTWGDGYGYLLVATGRAEAMVDPKANAWDIAAILPVIEEAGGKFTDWKGAKTIFSGDAVGTNGLVHDQVMKSLR